MKVIINGINGAMGKIVEEIINQDPDLEILAGVDSFNQPNSKYPIYKSISECIEKADIIIDFSHFSVISELLDYVESTVTPVVICTTGLTDETLIRIDKLSITVPIFRSGNMSLGINLLIDLVKKAAAALENNFDIEIIEKHHNKKVDSPSGTAYMIADEINETLNNSKEYVYGRSGNESKRNPNEIGIHAVRGGSIVGEHTVIFAGPDETIEIKHNAQSKRVFAQGAVKAAKFLVSQKPGLYEMNNMFN